jgi:hypothetical protein
VADDRSPGQAVEIVSGAEIQICIDWDTASSSTVTCLSDSMLRKTKSILNEIGLSGRRH